MNVLLILSALKKGREYTKGFLALALKYWYIVIITPFTCYHHFFKNNKE
jgi:hypothetical protein